MAVNVSSMELRTPGFASVVRDLTTDKNSSGIATAVIGMGRSLRIPVVAEGVETRQQLGILLQQDCPKGQGYYFCRPVPAEKLGHMLECGPRAAAFA
jgi:EAL domain-containing protein (putative c-di-GMP-specific phosphodiesterase class I)